MDNIWTAEADSPLDNLNIEDLLELTNGNEFMNRLNYSNSMTLNSNESSLELTNDDRDELEINESYWTNANLGWVHIFGAALFLDALWLIHRVLHTVDTAERILYGDVVFVDLTSQGKHCMLINKMYID